MNNRLSNRLNTTGLISNTGGNHARTARCPANYVLSGVKARGAFYYVDRIDSAPACGVGIPHPARRAVREGPVADATARTHGHFFSPNQGDPSSMGIAEGALQVAGGTKSWEREQGGESLDMLQGSSWSQTARSLPHALAKIREPTEQAQPQAGCGIGEEDARSFTQSKSA